MFSIFKEQSAMAPAMALAAFLAGLLLGRRWRPRSASGGPAASGADLYVGHLAPDVGEAELRRVFSAYGTVKDVRLVVQRLHGRAKRFAFISMGDRQEAQKAIRGLNRTAIGGREVAVSEARARRRSDG